MIFKGHILGCSLFTLPLKFVLNYDNKWLMLFYVRILPKYLNVMTYSRTGSAYHPVGCPGQKILEVKSSGR